MPRNALSMTRLTTVSPSATTIPAAAPHGHVLHVGPPGKVRVERAPDDVGGQPQPPAFGGERRDQVGELLAVALTPPAWVQPDETVHALASRIRPTWATSRVCSRYARSAVAPRP